MSYEISDGVYWSQTTRNRLPYIDVSIRSQCYDTTFCYSDWTYAEWTMELERSTDGGVFEYVDKRTGYVQDNSPSDRTFSNIMSKGRIRVFTRLHQGAYHGNIWLIDPVNY